MLTVRLLVRRYCFKKVGPFGVSFPQFVSRKGKRTYPPFLKRKLLFLFEEGINGLLVSRHAASPALLGRSIK
jgi:hypothetical protein